MRLLPDLTHHLRTVQRWAVAGFVTALCGGQVCGVLLAPWTVAAPALASLDSAPLRNTESGLPPPTLLDLPPLLFGLPAPTADHPLVAPSPDQPAVPAEGTTVVPTRPRRQRTIPTPIEDAASLSPLAPDDDALAPLQYDEALPLEARLNAGIRRQPGGPYDIDRRLVQAVVDDHALLQHHAPRLSPVHQDGQIRGYQLDNLQSGSVFSRIGLRNGDVLRAVDGVVVDSPQRGLQLYHAMMQRTDVAVLVERRGREVTLRYHLR